MSPVHYFCRRYRIFRFRNFFPGRDNGNGDDDDAKQVTVHEKSRYARQMFELMRRDIEEEARRFQRQSDADSLTSFLTFA